MVLPEVSWKGPGGPLEAWKCSPRRDPENPGPGRLKAPRTVRVRAVWVKIWKGGGLKVTYFTSLFDLDGP